MFKRITQEEWTTVVPIISFCLLCAVFVATTIRALRMPRGERDRLAALPTGNDGEAATQNESPLS